MFITNEPAMFIDVKKARYLLIGDLHLGITSELRRKGITMQSQVSSFVSRIKTLKKKTKAANLILIGDVKHKPQGISWQEEREIPLFLAELSKIFRKIIIVKGNHDGNIEKLVKLANNYSDLQNNYNKIAKAVSHDNKIKVRKSFVIGEYFITHGHRKIKPSKKIKIVVMAHNQPAIMLRDRSGATYVLPCWVRGMYNINSKTAKAVSCCKGKYNISFLDKINDFRRKSFCYDKELIIIPAFNPLSGHMIVNIDELLGPIAKKMINGRVYLLDGTDMGSIIDL
ncbi:MAG: metallophosphoesterase [Candidatus Aenigmarchaeota archaeon]|nr:metallophosphoesterase [Candidatus Aenigmarchaeota archaeon]